jgi:hypothetical protein
VLHSLAPLPLLFPFSQQHSALLVVSVCFVFVGGLIVVLNGCFLHGVFLLSFWCAHVGSVLSSTYRCQRTSAVLMVLSSTESTTVPWLLLYHSIYIVPLLCCAYKKTKTKKNELYRLTFFGNFVQGLYRYPTSATPMLVAKDFLVVLWW